MGFEVGTTVEIYPTPESIGGGPTVYLAAGEVHVAGDQAGPYTVRILEVTAAGAGRYHIGDLVPVREAVLHQRTLSKDALDDLSAPQPSGLGLLSDTRVVQYLGAPDRRKLAMVSRELHHRHAWVRGDLKVTPQVWAAIQDNVRRHEPPMRPDRGVVGQVTWMVIDGAPHTGTDPAKSQALTVQVFPGRPVGELEEVTSADLEYWYSTVERTQLTEILNRAENLVRATRADAWMAWGRRRTALQAQARELDEALDYSRRDVRRAIRDAEDEFSADRRYTVLARGNDDIYDAFHRSRAGRTQLGEQLLRDLVKRTRIERIMWIQIGCWVEGLPAQAAVVTLHRSRFSRSGDGRFLVVASRRYMYLIEPMLAEAQDEMVEVDEPAEGGDAIDTFDELEDLGGVPVPASTVTIEEITDEEAAKINGS